MKVNKWLTQKGKILLLQFVTEQNFVLLSNDTGNRVKESNIQQYLTCLLKHKNGPQKHKLNQVIGLYTAIFSTYVQ